MTCSCTTGLRRIQYSCIFRPRCVFFSPRGRCFLLEPRVLRHEDGAFCPRRVFCVTRAVLYVRAACFASRELRFMSEPRRLRRTSCALCPSRAGCAAQVASYARAAQVAPHKLRLMPEPRAFASHGLHLMPAPRVLRRTGCILCPRCAFFAARAVLYALCAARPPPLATHAPHARQTADLHAHTCPDRPPAAR